CCDRLDDRQRILHAVIELVQQQALQRLAVCNLFRHADGRDETNRQHDDSDARSDRKRPPERRRYAGHRYARGYCPTGQRRTRERRQQRHPFKRCGDELSLGLLQQGWQKRGRGLLADRLLWIGHPREAGACAVEDADCPFVGLTRPLDERLKDLQRWVKADLVRNCFIFENRHADDGDRLLHNRTDKNVRKGGTAGLKDRLDVLTTCPRRERFAGLHPAIVDLRAVSPCQGYRRDRRVAAQEDLDVAAKSLHVAASQRGGSAQDLKPAGDRPDFGVHRTLDRPNVIEHAVKGRLAL